MNIKWVVSMIVLCSWTAIGGDILVLKNGKQIQLNGGYEVKGAFVVFKTNEGDFHQLPIKAVDLERSKEVTEAEARRLAEAAEAAKTKQEEKVEATTLAEIAEYVEANRRPDNPPRSNIRIENGELVKFGDSNPRPQNTDAGVEYSLSGEFSAEAINGKRQELGQQYQSIQNEITEMDKQIAEMEDYVNLLASESAVGDEPTGQFYERMEQEQKKLEKLKQDRETKQNELSGVKKSARQVGLSNVDSYRAPDAKKKVKPRSNKLIEENKKRKGITYDPDEEEGDQ